MGSWELWWVLNCVRSISISLFANVNPDKLILGYSTILVNVVSTEAI